MYPRVWLFVAFLVSRIGFTEGIEQCRSAESSVYGMFLKGHTFTSFQTRIPAECQMKCEEDARCQSFNVILGANICELNSRTKEARPEDLVPDLDRIYMKRAFNRAPLGSIQELPTESCGEIKASEGNNMATSEYWIYSDGNAGQAILARCEAAWQKINTDPVCFGARDDKYGAFNMTKTGRVKTMKLIHKSGSLRCNTVDDDSYWGCANNNYANKMMTIITKANREAFLPPAEDLEGRNIKNKTRFFKKHCYSLEGSGNKSPELVLPKPPRPLSLSRGQELQIWYGQDWINCSEENNSGGTCVDVYAWYI